MKKMVRLLSVIMVIAMMFSMMASSAFAMIRDQGQSGTVVIGGGSSSSGNSGNGNLVIGGNVRPSDDTPYGGYSSGPNTGLETSDQEQYAKTYAGKGDYSDIENSTDINVQLNEDFLKFVRDNWDDETQVSPATLAFAEGFWGEELVKGTAIVETVAVEPTAVPEATETPADETEQESDEPQNIILAETPAPVMTAEPVEEPAEVENHDTSVPEEEDAEENEEPVQENEEPEQVDNEVVSEDAVAAEMAVKAKVIHATAIAKVTSAPVDSYEGGSTPFSSFLNGGTITMTKPFNICNSTDYRVTIDLNGTTINYTGSEAAFVIDGSGKYGSTITFTNGIINGDGFYVNKKGVLNLGGWININGLDITVNAKKNAVYVDDGTAVIAQGTTLRTSETTGTATSGTVYVAKITGNLRMTGGNIFGNGRTVPAVNNRGYFLLNSSGSNVNSSYANINNTTGAAIWAGDDGSTEIYAGTVLGETGIAVTETHKLSMYNGTVTGTGGPTAAGGAWNNGNTGAAIAVLGFAGETGIPTVTISGGALRSEKTAAIMDFKKTPDPHVRISAAERQQVTNITLSADKIITQQADKSDYQVALFTVNGVGYKTYAEAVLAANALSGTVTIKLGDDYKMTAADVATNFDNTNGATIVFDGNGHQITGVPGSSMIRAIDGKLTIQNVSIVGDNVLTTVGVEAVNTADVTVGTGVTIRKCIVGVRANTGAKATINDVNIAESVICGISVEDPGTKVTVLMVKDDSDIPVVADATDNLEIRGGWFLNQKGKGFETNPLYNVASYIDPTTSNLQYVKADKYYEVLYNTTPTVEVVSGETGTYNDKPYVVYDKGDATPVIFKVNPELVKVTAVALKPSKASYVLFATEGDGVKGNIRLADNEIIMHCPAGAYDLQFEFANGYVIKDKLNFYVYPKHLKLFEVPNDFNTSTLNVDSLKKYLTSDYEVDTYDVSDGHNFAAVMSELPDKIAIGSDADGKEVIYLENFINGVNTSYSVIPAGAPYAGDYLYFISYADLNNLAAGQNYCFMIYDDIRDESGDGAVESYPFVIKNSAVSINPTSVEWTSVSGTYANFTVKPDIMDENSVYIDGEKVDKAFWTYDKDTHVLAIKSSYLNALDKKSHTLEVITTSGKVGATVNTKVGLMPKNLDYHVYGGGKSLSFVASDKINKDGGIWIGSSNPTKLDPSCYVWDSENGFTLSAAFLNRLALGTYYVSAYVWDGAEYKYSTTSFKVISASQASYNPSTGDDSNIFIWLIVLALSAIAIVVIVLPKFKKQKAAEGVDAEMVEDKIKDK